MGPGTVSPVSHLQSPPGSIALMSSILPQVTLTEHSLASPLSSSLRTHFSSFPTLAVAHSPKHWLLQGFSDNMLDGFSVTCIEMEAKVLQGLRSPGVRNSKDGYSHLSVTDGNHFHLISLFSQVLLLLFLHQVPSAFKLPPQLCSLSQYCLLP